MKETNYIVNIFIDFYTPEAKLINELIDEKTQNIYALNKNETILI